MLRMNTHWIIYLAMPVLLTVALLTPKQMVHAHDTTHSEDAVAAAPHHHKLLMENETVRVLETRIAPGERTAVYTHQWPAAL